MSRLVAALLAVVLTAFAVPASAQVMQFRLSGAATATFQLPQDPVLLDSGKYPYTDDGTYYFTAANASASTYNGLPAVIPYVYFFSAPTGGLAFNVGASSVFAESVYSNEQVYTGSYNDPTFVPGTYQLQRANDPSVRYTLSITQAVPEPGAWMLMIVGFGIAGTALRRQRARSNLVDHRSQYAAA